MSECVSAYTSDVLKSIELDTVPAQRSLSKYECQETIPIREPANGLRVQNMPCGLDGLVDTLDSDSPAEEDPQEQQSNMSSCQSSSPLIQVVNPEKLPQSSDSLRPPSSGHKRTLSKSMTLVKVNFVYNEYGELVDETEMQKHQTTDQLTPTQILRVIKKHYHHELRSRLGKILVAQFGGINSILVNDEMWRDKLSSWDFRPGSPRSTSVATPDDIHVAGSHSPRRVLEIGCSDGAWCVTFKKELPDWIVEGVDDTNHWMCGQSPVLVKDFMAMPRNNNSTDYFNNAYRIQEKPEFTVRNLNRLLAHENPLPRNIYEFIRAREIFDRIESYKTFLEDIRLMLKPDGVVEFFEIDPRPRAISLGLKPIIEDRVHKSAPQTDWTDNIEDRFKDPLDGELATTTPGWTARVAERMKANVRPRDGVPAANLKSWLEGAGFYDVKQLIIAIHVGGNTPAGQLLKEFLKYQIELEDEIPKLREDLPKIEMSHLESGAYYLNLHVVTARKPQAPRPGDLLPSGERQEMTASKYDAMARLNDSKSSQWKRFDLEGKLTSMMHNLTTLPGAPDTITVTRSGADKRVFPMVGRHSDIVSPFHAPAFVTMIVQDTKHPSTTHSTEITP